MVIYECPVFPSAAPLASALSTRFSHRSVVIIGGLMCSVGVMLGAFARNLIELYFTVGLLNGKMAEANKQTHIHTTHSTKRTNKCAIYWSPLLHRVWLCIDMDPHSDHGGLVL